MANANIGLWQFQSRRSFLFVRQSLNLSELELYLSSPHLWLFIHVSFAESSTKWTTITKSQVPYPDASPPSISLNHVLVLVVFLPSTSPISSRPELDPCKIYSPKPVFAYNTVHFDLVRSFSPDEPEHTISPKSSCISVVSRKRPREVDLNPDVDDAVFAKKRLKAANHVSNVKIAKSNSSRLSSCPLALSTHQLRVIRNT